MCQTVWMPDEAPQNAGPHLASKLFTKIINGFQNLPLAEKTGKLGKGIAC